MKISLIKNKVNPVDISVGSARTCYSVNLKTPDSISKWSGKKGLLLDLFKSGHHTTLQHVNFTFQMEGISRLSIWRFFHSHRFYNSDQVSQRYTEVNESLFKSFNNSDIDSYHNSLIEKYYDLIRILTPIYENSSNKVVVKNAKKHAMENARYILPQSVLANMYHTINLSTLLRYKASLKFNVDCNEEISEIVNLMVQSVINAYPDLSEIFNYVDSQSKKIKSNNLFEIQSEKLLSILLCQDKPSKLIDHSGFVSNVNNNFPGDNMGLSALFNSEAGLENFTFNLKLSLSADSQNQRHRTAYSIRPELGVLLKHNCHEYYIPDIFHENEEAMEIYSAAINESKVIISKNEILAPYLLLNGYVIAIKEVNSCLDFVHKSEKRLCLNSQEEITKMTWNMVESLIKNSITADFGKKLAPPCYHRYIEGINPICPEGSRFCGVKEWKNHKYEN